MFSVSIFCSARPALLFPYGAHFVLLLNLCSLHVFLMLFFLIQEHLHYDVVKSADLELKKATIQINVYKQHRQTIQVIT
jgi:hypothetical protein